MKPLNEYALRETHSMPKVDTSLAQMTGATMFSKLDMTVHFATSDTMYARYVCSTET